MRKIKEFNDFKSFYSFVNNFDGETVCKGGKVYYNNEIVAIFKRTEA